VRWRDEEGDGHRNILAYVGDGIASSVRGGDSGEDEDGQEDGIDIGPSPLDSHNNDERPKTPRLPQAQADFRSRS
jgi:hypothetical protein